MSTPSDPQYPPPYPQQQPQSWPSTGEQPAYPGSYQQQPYGYQGYPGYQRYGQYGGYGEYGGWPGYEQPSVPPRRPAVLIIAGIVWLLLGGIMLLLGVVMLVANRWAEFDQVYAENPDLTPELFTGIGIVMTVLAVIVIGLAIAVFSGALWARIAIAVIGGLLGLLAFATVLLPIMAIAAIILQFLPAANDYAKARSRRTA